VGGGRPQTVLETFVRDSFMSGMVATTTASEWHRGGSAVKRYRGRQEYVEDGSSFRREGGTKESAGGGSMWCPREKTVPHGKRGIRSIRALILAPLIGRGAEW